jgi:predicted O-methyltransferase YrrM
MALTPEAIEQQLDIPEWDTYSAIKPEEAAFLYQFVQQHNLRHTLEVGFAFARSASHIAAAHGGPHTAMDPFQDRYGNMGVSNMDKLGLGQQLTLHRDFSHNVLPALLREGRTFDFIFIDGDHKFDGILVDFYYAALLLKPGGFVMMHDTWMRTTRLVESFVQSNRKDFQYQSTPLRNLSLFQKTAEDPRDGMHFREFYTWKSLIPHHGIQYLTNGKMTPLKKFLFWVKDKVK